MIEDRFIWVQSHKDGRLANIWIGTYDELMRKLFPAAKPRRKDGVFGITGDESEDIHNLKQAVAGVGSVARLSHILGVTVQAIYKWVERDTVSKEHRGKLAEMAEAADAGESMDRFLVGGDDSDEGF